MNRLFLVLAVNFAVLAASGDAAEAGPSRFALLAGRVYTVSGGVIEPATILVEDGKIAAVGAGVAVPDGVPQIDLRAHVVIPGLIDAATTLASDLDDSARSVAPEVRALDGWDFFADRRELLRGGVTTVYVSPGASVRSGRLSRLVSGRGAVVKVAGHAADPLRRVLREECGVQVTLGESSKRQPSVYDPPVPPSPDRPFEVIETVLPQSRAGAFLALRRLLGRGRSYHDGVRSSLAGAGPAPAPDVEASALYALFSGHDHLRLRANRARDVWRVLTLAREHGLKLVVEGGREAERLSEWLARDSVPVVFSGAFQPGSVPRGDLSIPTTEGRFDEESVIRLARAGVRVVIHSPGEAGVRDLLLQAAAAVRMGMEPEAALRAVTLHAAEALGVEARVGSIEPGKDADLVVLDGDPLSGTGRPQAVLSGGELVWRDAPDLEPEDTVVRCGRILTGRGAEHRGGVIVVRSGKVRYVGPGVFLEWTESRAQVVAALDGVAGALDTVAGALDTVAVPGFIDCGSSAGTHAESLRLRFSAEAGSRGAKGSASFRLAEAVDPADPDFRELVAAGITTVLITPEVSGGISGQVSALKLSAPDATKALIRPYAAMLLGSVPADDLKRAKKYHEDWKTYEGRGAQASGAAGGTAAPPASPDKAPDRDESLEPLRELFAGRVPVLLHGAGVAAAASGAKRLREEFGLRVVAAGVAGPERGAALARGLDELRRWADGVVLEPPFVVVEAREKVHWPQETARRGLPVAFRSGAASGAKLLPLQVAYAVREGWDGSAALEAMTYGAARQFGLDERVGSIAPGLDADVVFLSGEPFALTTRVLGVMVEGRMVYEVSDVPVR
jgi:imidazolonepropionase-like amidohydrolase